MNHEDLIRWRSHRHADPLFSDLAESGILCSSRAKIATYSREELK